MRPRSLVALAALVCSWGAVAPAVAFEDSAPSQQMGPNAGSIFISRAEAALHPDSVEEIVRRVQNRIDATADFTAAVDQELVVASAGKTLHAKGTVAFKRPGRMRWTLTDGTAQVIVADGTTLWFYQPDEQQVLKAPFQAAFRSSTPISFLTGVGRLGEDFEVTLDGEGDGVVHLALRPRKAEGELGRLRLTVDARSFDIVGAEISDPVGNVTRLRFSELRRNTGLHDDDFHFEVPPGVDVIEAPIGN
jgi:outer membrane lipoprotein carrier protein